MPTAAQGTADSAIQDGVNRAVYHRPGVQHYYGAQHFYPAETALLLKYQPRFSGRAVLDVGVGAGRTSRYLLPVAGRYQAIDYSPVMVGYMRARLPHVPIVQADFRDLSDFADASFDFVFATDNVIDALGHDDRLRALRESRRVLRPGGVLAFSSHNLDYRYAFAGPRLDRSRNPVTQLANLAQYWRRWRNHRAVGPLREKAAGYALINDTGHDFACLHYYISLPAQTVQLAQAGFGVLDVFDHEGRTVKGSDDSPNLFYLAE